MKIFAPDASRFTEMVSLVRDTFTASEGTAEGALVSTLAKGVLSTSNHADIHAFATEKNGTIIAAIVFSALHYADDARRVCLLSPVAVLPEHQRKGVGAALIRHGIGTLQQSGVEVAVTYGDPAYYSRFGFAQVSVATVPPPDGISLSLPHGWLAQSLSENTLSPLKGRCSCVPAMNNQDVW